MENSLHSTQTFIENLQELLTDSDNDVGQFYFQEEMIEKVVQDFYKEIACSPLPKPPSPVPMPLPSLSPSNAKVGMQGTENESLVVELQGGSDEFVGFEVVGDEERMEQGLGCEDGGDFDDEWMARVISCVQVVNGFNENGNVNGSGDPEE